MSREQADEKLARACEAGVNLFLPEGQEVDRIVKKEFTPSPIGPDFRHVTLTAFVKGDWLEQEHKYECDFQESFGFMGGGYTASIERLDAEGTVIGRAGGAILGDAQDFIKLTEAIRKALYE
ncbi:MAG: hypothetical protein HY370_07320 [Proteobacteria bacterium]|nr:hypothetical protein [Pseudomonadota bacterium]